MEKDRNPLVEVDTNAYRPGNFEAVSPGPKEPLVAKCSRNQQVRTLRITAEECLTLEVPVSHKAAALQTGQVCAPEVIKVLEGRDVLQKLLSEQSSSCSWLQRSNTRRMNKLEATLDQHSAQLAKHSKSLQQLSIMDTGNVTFETTLGKKADSSSASGLPSTSIDLLALKEEVLSCRRNLAKEQEERSHLNVEVQQLKALVSELIEQRQLAKSETAEGPGGASNAAPSSPVLGTEDESNEDSGTQGVQGGPEEEVVSAGDEQLDEEPASAVVASKAADSRQHSSALEKKQAEEAQAEEAQAEVSAALAQQLSALELSHKIAMELATSADRRAAEAGQCAAAVKQRQDTLEWGFGKAILEHKQDIASVRQSVDEQISNMQASIRDEVKVEASTKQKIEERIVKDAAALESLRQAVQEMVEGLERDLAGQWDRMTTAMAQLYSDVGSELGELQKHMHLGPSQSGIIAEVIGVLENQEGTLTNFTRRIESLEGQLQHPGSQGHPDTIYARLHALENNQKEQWQWMSRTTEQVYANLGGEISAVERSMLPGTRLALGSADEAPQLPTIVEADSEEAEQPAKAGQAQGSGQLGESETAADLGQSADIIQLLEGGSYELASLPSDCAVRIVLALQNQEVAMTCMGQQIRALEERVKPSCVEEHTCDASVCGRLADLETAQELAQQALSEQVAPVVGCHFAGSQPVRPSPPQGAAAHGVDAVDESPARQSSSVSSTAYEQSGSSSASEDHPAVHAVEEEIEGQISSLAERLVTGDRDDLSKSDSHLLARTPMVDDAPPATPQSAAALEALAATPVTFTTSAVASRGVANSTAAKSTCTESFAAEMQQLATIEHALVDMHSQHNSFRYPCGVNAGNLEVALHCVSRNCADSLAHVTAGAIQQARITATLAERVAAVEARMTD